MPFVPIPEILEELKAGRPIVLVDDEDRENEGDVVYAAEKCDAAAINFMVKYSRGLVCLALTNEQCDKLRLHPQTHINTAQLGTAFTVTVDAHPRFGVTTGVSAKDRAKTIEVAIAEDGPELRFGGCGIVAHLACVREKVWGNSMPLFRIHTSPSP